jgi:hypothetical protein
VHAGSGDRVDSKALIHAGVLRHSESAPFLELLLVDFAARKVLLENVERSLHKGNEVYTVARAQAAMSPRSVRFGSKADITAGSRHVCFIPDSGHSSVPLDGRRYTD